MAHCAFFGMCPHEICFLSPSESRLYCSCANALLENVVTKDREASSWRMKATLSMNSPFALNTVMENSSPLEVESSVATPCAESNIVVGN